MFSDTHSLEYKDIAAQSDSDTGDVTDGALTEAPHINTLPHLMFLCSSVLKLHNCYFYVHIVHIEKLVFIIYRNMHK